MGKVACRRRRSALVLCALALVTQLAPASAQSWPARPIVLITPFPPGAGPDVHLRPLFARVAEHVGGTIVHEVRTGAGGTIALRQAMQATPDGHTLALLVNSNVIERYLRPDSSPDPLNLAHVSRIATGPGALMVASDSSVRRLEDLIADARRSPGKLNFGSSGPGTPSHLQAATLQALTGIETVHVPFRSTADVIPALIRGDVQFAFQGIAFAVPYARSGRLRVLATTGGQRSPQFPDVPALRELLPSELAVQENWAGVAFPVGTPTSIVRRMHAAIQSVLGEPAVRRSIENFGDLPAPSESPDAFAAFIRAENGKWREIVKLSRAGID
ncbi:MAG: tripartite tricarboxylate transporter substrate binding protein [Betaproteobacteria bacterium]|nr:MAG: tripartite tricarboxylate transporter substrate binding protein [Betaproteobacteria bacterium]